MDDLNQVALVNTQIYILVFERSVLVLTCPGYIFFA